MNPSRFEERSAGNLHAAFCGSRRRVIASGDLVDQTLPGDVSRADGWLSVNQEAVRAWARDSGVQPYVLIRTLGHLPGCRVTPDGGLMVREES